MIVKIFAILDLKAQAFSQPFFASTTEVGQRMFGSLVNDGQSGPFKYPDDFTLFELGSFNDGSGEIDPLDKLVNLGMAISYKEKR